MELMYIEIAYNEIKTEIERLTDGQPIAKVIDFTKQGSVLISYLDKTCYGILNDGESVSIDDLMIVLDSTTIPFKPERTDIDTYTIYNIKPMDKRKADHLKLLMKSLEDLNSILSYPFFENEV